MQQGIPLLPFDYATESVDHVSRRRAFGRTRCQWRLPHSCVMGIDELIRRTAEGQRVKYLHFWGHRARRDGTLGAGCLSQWWPSPFEADGVRYETAEHWMMAAKARLFGDAEAERAALAARTPAEAKNAGRLVRGFDEAIWKRERFAVVRSGNVHKFGQDAALRDFLLATGDRVLVEASPMDRIWGIGLASDDERAQDPARWRGLNLLGFALMEAREELRGGVSG